MQKKVTLASIAAVVGIVGGLIGIATGAISIKDDLGGGIPSYEGDVGNFAASRSLLTFLREHDGDVVRLKVGWMEGPVDPEGDRHGNPQWGAVYERCTRPVPSGEQPDPVDHQCSGTTVILTGPATPDSEMYLNHGGLRIHGYFVVRLDDEVRMDFEHIGLRPMALEDARAAAS